MRSPIFWLPRPSRDGEAEAGIVLVLVALSMTVVIGVAAVAIDLGTSYSQSRSVQNSSDNASLAATRVLECYDLITNTNSTLYDANASTDGRAVQLDCPTGASAYTASQVASTASQTVQNNGSMLVSCKIISYYGITGAPTPPGYNVIDTNCSDAGWQTNANADGVYVESYNRQSTSFGKAVGTSQLSQYREAASTIQPLVNPGGSSVIMVCSGFDAGTAQTDFNNNQPIPPLLNQTVNPDGTVTWSLNDTEATASTPWNGPVYNPSLGGPTMELHGPGIDTCNLQSNGWKGIGIVNGTLPGWFDVTTGDRAGPTRAAIAGQPGCSGTPINTPNCELLLPICTDSNSLGGSNGQLYCVAWGAFQLLNWSVSGNSGNEQLLGFLGTATTSSGQTGTGPPTSTNPVVVQLVQ